MLQPLTPYECSFTNCAGKDFGFSDKVRKVSRSRMGYRNGGVARQKELGKRFADNVAPANHERPSAFYGNIVVVQQGNPPGWRRRHVTIET
jgi:hypothetical protein